MAFIKTSTPEMQAHAAALSATVSELEGNIAAFRSAADFLEQQIMKTRSQVDTLLAEVWQSSAASGAYQSLQASWNSHTQQLKTALDDLFAGPLTACKNDLETISSRVGVAAVNYEDGEAAVRSAIGS